MGSSQNFTDGTPKPGAKTAGLTNNSRRAADELFETFEAMISDGRLKAGDRLPPEREIVDTYKVSRTVVREAILALSAKGLVEARPRFRPIVRPPSYDSAVATMDTVVTRMLKEPGGIRNMFETRILVEAALVRDAARTASEDDLARLSSALAENHDAIDDDEMFYLTDMRFHQVFYTISDNPVLIATHQAYTSWLAPQWSRMPREVSRNRGNFEAHRAIFEQVVAKDADGAEQALRAHLDTAWTQVRQTFGDL